MGAFSLEFSPTESAAIRQALTYAPVRLGIIAPHEVGRLGVRPGSMVRRRHGLAPGRHLRVHDIDLVRRRLPLNVLKAVNFSVAMRWPNGA